MEGIEGMSHFERIGLDTWLAHQFRGGADKVTIDELQAAEILWEHLDNRLWKLLRRELALVGEVVTDEIDDLEFQSLDR